MITLRHIYTHQTMFVREEELEKIRFVQFENGKRIWFNRRDWYVLPEPPVSPVERRSHQGLPKPAPVPKRRSTGISQPLRHKKAPTLK